MTEVYLGVGMFTGVILLLVVMILVLRSKLVATGDINIEVNGSDGKTLTIAAGAKKPRMRMIDC